ncbi:DUF7573 domain-containing protein [Halorientalis regularis]|jgi:hypothetical protein|uniref:DUF7573 domain-containing protein n=1 Tax=Halorientalis regularis TaxID=660518 RepID=A0A1G7L2P9_9EURY|nr:hypothetical protein [Halorientalis regularis]SDF43661.1 hypothetical protein SAMN05216218_106134 [Halorientalis regularis]
MDDASLDEFANASDDDADDDGADADAPEPAEEPATGSEAVAPATSTYAWTGDGTVCGACGESVARRWRDGDDLVCADCKEW